MLRFEFPRVVTMTMAVPFVLENVILYLPDVRVV